MGDDVLEHAARRGDRGAELGGEPALEPRVKPAGGAQQRLAAGAELEAARPAVGLAAMPAGAPFAPPWTA